MLPIIVVASVMSLAEYQRPVLWRDWPELSESEKARAYEGILLPGKPYRVLNAIPPVGLSRRSSTDGMLKGYLRNPFKDYTLVGIMVKVQTSSGESTHLVNIEVAPRQKRMFSFRLGKTDEWVVRWKLLGCRAE